MIIIPKYAQGAGLEYLDFTPVTVNRATPGATTDTDDSTAASKKSITNSDILSLLKGVKGLPSDMRKIYAEMQQFYMDLEIGGTLGSINTLDLSMLYLKILKDIQDAEYHRAAHDQAWEQIKGSDKLTELAITANGKLVMLGKDGITYGSLADFHNAKGELSLLTNQDLLYMRAESLAGHDTLTSLAAGGVGMQDVTKVIQETAKSLGNTTDEEDLYVDTRTKELREGLKLLLLDPEGLYKVTKYSQQLNRQMLSAASWLYHTLNPNMRMLLDTRAGADGEGIKLIGDLLGSHTSSTTKLKLDMIENANGAKPGSKESADSKSGVNVTAAMRLAMGEGEHENLVFNAGQPSEMQAHSIVGYLTKDNKNLTIGNSLYDVGSGDFGQSIDLGNAFIGTNKIGSLSHVLLRNNRAHLMNIPIVEDPETHLKRPAVDKIDVLRRIQDASEGKTPEELNVLYEKANLPKLWIQGSDGLYYFNNDRYGTYLGVEVMTDEKGIEGKVTGANPFLTEVSADLKKEFEEYINNGRQKGDKLSYSDGVPFLGIGKDYVYSGIALIPYRRDVIAAAISSGQYFQTPGKSYVTAQAGQRAMELADQLPVYNGSSGFASHS